MNRCALFLLFMTSTAVGQSTNEDGYPSFESLAVSGDGRDVFFVSHLLLRGEEARTSSFGRMYRYAPGLPKIEITESNGEQFFGAFLANDGSTLAQYCGRTEGSFKPILYDGVCLTRQGQRSFYRGTSARISRNARFLFQVDGYPLLRDLTSGEVFPLPGVRPLHTHNALSDNGTLVTHFVSALTSIPNRRTVALARPGAAQRLLFEGGVISLAAISPDAVYVFLREDREDTDGMVSSLIEIEVASGIRRMLFQTKNDRFNFSLDHDAQHVMIRYFQAISIWNRATNSVSRIADSPDLIVSAVLSDDGSTVAYQRSSGAITKVNTVPVTTDEENPYFVSEELYGDTPNKFTPQGRTTYPGSAVFFSTSGFSQDSVITIDGLPIPILRLHGSSIQYQELLLQIPWELPLPAFAGSVLVTQPGSPFVLKASLTFQREPTPSFFNFFDPLAGAFVLFAALEDFSSLTSSSNPALAGSIIHAYLGALGPLDQPIRTGEAGPADPPARPLAQMTCELRNLETNSAFRQIEVPTLVYAPGLIGAYQADFRIPGDWPGGRNLLRCKTSLTSSDQTLLFTKAQLRVN